MEVKGLAIVSTLEWVKKNHGEEAELEIRSQLKEEEQQMLAFDGCKALWYPFDLYKRISVLVMNKYGGGDVKFLRQIGAYTAEHDKTIIPKLFYKIGTPQFIIRLGTWGFRRYFSEGNVTVRESHKGKVLFEIYKTPIVDPVYYERIAGWMTRAIELSGGKNVKSVVEVREEGGSEIILFTNTWE
ncbi:hypothetical protein KAU33_14110 [Candidatus Dependentiae bacterium]|nr:hypothetical protein [Candidatus Dependentiae bacterium]